MIKGRQGRAELFTRKRGIGCEGSQAHHTWQAFLLEFQGQGSVTDVDNGGGGFCCTRVPPQWPLEPICW